MGYRLLDLYQSPEEKEHRIRKSIDDIRARVERIQQKFIFFIGLSLSIHLLVFGLVFYKAHPQGRLPEARVQSNERAMSRAVMEAAAKAALKTPAPKSGVREEMEKLANSLDQLFRLDPRLTEKEKTEIFRNLLTLSSELDLKDTPGGSFDPSAADRLIEILKSKTGFKLASGDSLLIARPSPDGAYEVYKLDRASVDKLKHLGAEAANNNARAPSGEDMIRVATEDGPRSIPEEYYFRASPYQEMMAKGPRLFTAVKGFPDLGLKEDEGATKGQPSPPKTATKKPAPGPAFVYLVRGRPPLSRVGGREVLKLSGNERERVLDELMALRVQDQLDVFGEKYLDKYDLDQGDLAGLTRDFLFSNMNSVFFMTDRLSSAFDFVEELYFKRNVYDFFASYACRFPKTGTGIELLFYLASAYDFERRALENLFASSGEVNKIAQGKLEPQNVFKPAMKAFVADRIYHDTYRIAEEMGFSPEDLLDQYSRREEEIYEMLSGFGGETKNRALYGWGRLCWGEGNFAVAVQKWEQVDVSFPLNSRAYWRIIDKLSYYDFNYCVMDIDRALAEENAFDKLDLLRRHLKFHTWKKRAE